MNSTHFFAKNSSYESVTSFPGLKANIHLKTNLGWNCLDIAALNELLNLCKKLIDKQLTC